MRVSDVYHPGALTCDVRESMAGAARVMRTEGVGCLAVVDGDSVTGIVSERDVVRVVAEGRDLATTHCGDVATRDVHTAAPDDDTRDTARRMLDSGIRHLPVEEEGRLLGMISMRDLLAVESWL